MVRPQIAVGEIACACRFPVLSGGTGADAAAAGRGWALAEGCFAQSGHRRLPAWRSYLIGVVEEYLEKPAVGRVDRGPGRHYGPRRSG
jgi:hypothetical protein